MGTKLTSKAAMDMAVNLFYLAQRRPTDLAEMLLTDSSAMQVLEESLTKYIKQRKQQIEQTTPPELLSPTVHATCDINEQKLEAVDVTLWLALASDDELRNLREEQYGGDASAEIIVFMAFFNTDIEALYFVDSDPLIACQIHQEEVEAWLAVHRPHIVTR